MIIINTKLVGHGTIPMDITIGTVGILRFGVWVLVLTIIQVGTADLVSTMAGVVDGIMVSTMATTIAGMEDGADAMAEAGTTLTGAVLMVGTGLGVADGITVGVVDGTTVGMDIITDTTEMDGEIMVGKAATIQNLRQYLVSLGLDRIEVEVRKGFLIMPT